MMEENGPGLWIAESTTLENTLLQSRIDAFMAIAPKVIARYYRPDCWVAATRITCEVFKQFDTQVRPFKVKVLVFNARYREFVEQNQRFPTPEERKSTGAHSIGLGYTDPLSHGKPSGIGGHVVTIVGDDEALIDPTITQAHRPQHAIRLEPIWRANPPESFLAGQDELVVHLNGCTLLYQPFPEDHAYQRSPDWHELDRIEPQVREIHRRMIDLLSRRKAAA